MTAGYKGHLDFQKVGLGYVKTDDGSLIIVRVAIIDVKPTGRRGPFGLEFNVDFTVGVAVRPSTKVREEIKDKPLVEPGKTVEEGWIEVEILEKSNAYEEVIYREEAMGEYSIRIEVEPLMVARNTLYKVSDDIPYYTVRWAPKVLYKLLTAKGGVT
jgi:hypothetical protein